MTHSLITGDKGTSPRLKPVTGDQPWAQVSTLSPSQCSSLFHFVTSYYCQMVTQCSQMSDNKNRLLVLLVVMSIELFLQLNYLKPDPESKKLFVCK